MNNVIKLYMLIIHFVILLSIIGMIYSISQGRWGDIPVLSSVGFGLWLCSKKVVELLT